MSLKVKFQKNLYTKKKSLEKIIIFKNKEWKFGKISQMNWIKKNLKNNDVHVTLKYKNKLIGYTMLRNRILTNKNKLRKRFYFFDTHLIDLKFRKKLINKKLPSNVLMNNILSYIKKNKKIAFLLCKKKLVNYYRFHGWKVMSQQKYKINNNKKLVLMSFGKINIKNIILSI